MSPVCKSFFTDVDTNATYTPGISERRGSTSTFLHSGVKNADVQTTAAQTIAATRQYDAFGNVVSNTGTWSGPFGYAGGFGYQEDATGLKLLGHRYYDSSTGRFLTRDSVKDGRNWYVYAHNDPATYVDPDGLNILNWLKDKWYSLTVVKEPIDIVRPPAAVAAGALIMWAIWKLAEVAHGVHEPTGGNPKQGGLPGMIPAPDSDHMNSTLPSESNIRFGRTAKSEEYWADPDK